MKKNVWVNRVQDGWAVIDGTTQVGELFTDETRAHLAAHHYSHAPSLQSQLKIKKCETGYHGRPFWSVDVLISKTGTGECKWELNAEVDGIDRSPVFYVTLNAALRAVQKIGGEKVTTRNILNPEAGEFEIDRASKGGCCDPGTETYHCM